MLDLDLLNDLKEWVLKEGTVSPLDLELAFDPDLAYGFGQTRENQRSVLPVLSKFKCPIGIVGHDGTEQGSGFPGFSAWEAWLLNDGIPANRIVPVQGCFAFDDQGRFTGNTLTEAAAVVRHAKAQNLKRIVIVAPNFHLTRCVMTTVGVILREYPELRIRVALGIDLPLDEMTTHSQGKLRVPRGHLFWYECVRILKYHNEKKDGDGIPAAEALIPSIPKVEDVFAYFAPR